MPDCPADCPLDYLPTLPATRQTPSPSPQPSRRRWLAGALAGGCLALSPPRAARAQVGAAEPTASPKEVWTVGASMALSGPLGAPTQLFEAGLRLGLERANRQGGVQGRPLRWMPLDDASDAQRAEANTRTLIHEHGVLALLGSSGTAQVMAALPLAEASGTPLVGPATGSPALRARHSPVMFHVRASYRDELAKILTHAATVALRRVAVFHVDDAFGQMVASQVSELMAQQQLKPVAVAAARFEQGDVGAAAQQIAAQQPQALIVGAIGQNFSRFIAAYRALGVPMPQCYGLSFIEPSLLASTLGAQARGIILTQVMPSVRNPAIPIVREYRQALAELRAGTEATVLGLDGYLTARVLVEALGRSVRPVSRATLIGALDGLSTLDLGGFAVRYGPRQHNGAGLVNLAIVGAQGQLQY